MPRLRFGSTSESAGFALQASEPDDADYHTPAARLTNGCCFLCGCTLTCTDTSHPRRRRELRWRRFFSDTLWYIHSLPSLTFFLGGVNISLSFATSCILFERTASHFSSLDSSKGLSVMAHFVCLFPLTHYGQASFQWLRSWPLPLTLHPHPLLLLSTHAPFHSLQ